MQVLQRDLGSDGKDILKLSQGIVHWKPPPEALEAAKRSLDEMSDIHGYGDDEGCLLLREMISTKLKNENNITNSQVMVTAGANQAFTNVVLATADAQSSIILWPPYYFNHKMAIQMTGGSSTLELGQPDPHTLVPDPWWLEDRIKVKNNKTEKKIAACVLCNPCNPTGVVIPGSILKRFSDICKKNGIWLIVDNTYEYFLYDGARHETVEGPHIINIFSFSKAYGMMGWRLGYIAYPESLGPSLLKVQDTIPICPTQISEHVGIGALRAGRTFVEGKLESIRANRKMLLEALKPLKVVESKGAIYLFVKLPDQYVNDSKVVKWLASKHGVLVIPGTSCGAPGYFRVSYANMIPKHMEVASKRLRSAVQDLLTRDRSKPLNM
uniref:Aminotransferase class I/classII large domain-containing protein n=1 Tax=Amorphochlora amoebiformis TaxID=1561963 RepID=A0A7S0DSD0_9EUKA